LKNQALLFACLLPASFIAGFGVVYLMAVRGVSPAAATLAMLVGTISCFVPAVIRPFYRRTRLSHADPVVRSN